MFDESTTVVDAAAVAWSTAGHPGVSVGHETSGLVVGVSTHTSPEVSSRIKPPRREQRSWSLQPGGLGA